VQAVADDPYIELGKLLPLHNADDLEALLIRDSGLFEPGVAALLRNADPLPGMRRIFLAAARLIEDARSDPRTAWSVYEKAMADSRRQGEELASEVMEIERALVAGRYAEVLERVEEPLSRADRSGDVEACAVLMRQRGKALWATEGPDRIENQERALVDLTAAASMLGSDPVVQAQAALELGAASLERIEWDRTWNLEHGLAMIRLAEKTLRGTELEETLDLHLVEALILQESGDVAAHFLEAEGLARAMVTSISSGGDAVDGVAKQLLLARVLRRGVEIGLGDRGEAEAAFEAILVHPDGIPAPLLGMAGSELGQLLLRSTDHDPDSAFEELVAWLIPPDGEAEEREVLTRARDLLEAALDRVRGTEGFALAIALASLAEALQRLGDFEPAISRNREALQLLTPRVHPERARPCAERLGEMLGDRGTWTESADAYGVAIEAAEILYGRRRGAAGRQREAMLTLGLARKAAFSVAKTGDPRRAVQLLESSRNREFRRQLGEAGGSKLVERETDFDRAVVGGAPVFYLNPSRWGTVLLTVSPAAEGARFEAVFLDRPTGMEVYRRLFIGDGAAATEPKEVLQAKGSYLIGISIFEEHESETARERRQREEQRRSQLRIGIEEVLPWLGDEIARAVDGVASRLNTNTVVLIPCGILALAPLHAAPWAAAEGPRCLLDRWVVRYSPSALLAGIAAQRADERRALPNHLVGIADPRNDLEAARAELEAIAARFDHERSAIAYGSQATIGFLRDHLAGATHLHVAGHATASVDWRKTGLLLADDFLPALELERLGALTSRLAVVSACQGATQETALHPDEAFAITTALLEAGSACAIGSLWPVDDEATALLMTKLYDEIAEPSVEPAAALRRAQIWLRDLTARELFQFLEAHPALGSAIRSRRISAILRPQGRPFSHPDFWAAFVAVGE
jgi:CHAT domain-containing protein